jgi:hypothetical protein
MPSVGPQTRGPRAQLSGGRCSLLPHAPRSFSWRHIEEKAASLPQMVRMSGSVHCLGALRRAKARPFMILSPIRPAPGATLPGLFNQCLHVLLAQASDTGAFLYRPHPLSRSVSHPCLATGAPKGS